MPILTLTTDWGLRDHYVAAFKGELMSCIPALQLVDISHDVEKFDTMHASFIVQNTFRKFPVGSIHFIGLTCLENCNSKLPYLIVKTNGHYLIGQDNGIFTLILAQDDKEIVRLPIDGHSNRSDQCSLLVSLIKNLTETSDFHSLGTSESVLEESYFALPTVDSQTIRGTIIFQDTFGNAVVNIKEDLFEKEKKGRPFTILLRKSTYNVSNISKTYEDVDVGEMLALFNNDGYLEIALNKDSASKLLGLKLMDPIRIEFYDHQTSPAGF